MKHHIFLGGNENELLFDEVNIRFLVHKSLIDINTRDMIHKYIVSLRAPVGIRVKFANDVYVFKPAQLTESDPEVDMDDYLWFAL